MQIVLETKYEMSTSHIFLKKEKANLEDSASINFFILESKIFHIRGTKSMQR